MHNDAVELKQCCASTGERLDTVAATLVEIRDAVSTGLTAVAAALQGVQTRQDLANRISVHQVAQLDTVICILEHISANTCETVNQGAQEVDAQIRIARSVDELEHMIATAAPAAALELERARVERARLEECCPSPPPRRPCDYSPCPTPEPLSVRDEGGADVRAQARVARSPR